MKTPVYPALDTKILPQWLCLLFFIFIFGGFVFYFLFFWLCLLKENPFEVCSILDTTRWELFKKFQHWGLFLVVQWLRLCTPNAGVPCSIPAQGTRSHMLQLRLCMSQLTPDSANKNKYFLKLITVKYIFKNKTYWTLVEYLKHLCRIVCKCTA